MTHDAAEREVSLHAIGPAVAYEELRHHEDLEQDHYDSQPRHLLSIDDLRDDELVELTSPTRVDDVHLRPGLMALLFQQPSVRTMASFCAAAVRVGLAPLPVPVASDALRAQHDFFEEIGQLSLIASCVVVRSQQPLPREDVLACGRVPVINGGDGSNEHPTQTLLDLRTMRAFGLEGKTVALMGNLRDHRVHHSLARALVRLGVRLRLVSTAEVALPERFIGRARRGQVETVRAESRPEVDRALSGVDFLYLTPTQFWNVPHLSYGDVFKMDRARAARVLKPGAKILHPFPRLDELDRDLDGTGYDAYHLQTSLGPSVRARLLRLLLGRSD